MQNDAREMSMSDDSKQKAWLEHYQRLLNAEFDWDPNICLMNRQCRGDQIFFSAICPGQVASKNPLVLKNFLLVSKYFSNRKSIGQIANTFTTISYSKCNSNQYMRGPVT